MTIKDNTKRQTKTTPAKSKDLPAEPTSRIQDAQTEPEGKPTSLFLANKLPPDFRRSGAVIPTRADIARRESPPKNKFFRVMPHNWTEYENAFSGFFYRHEPDGEMERHANYLVKHESDAYRALIAELKPMAIVLAVTHGGGLFFWEVKLPYTGAHEMTNRWGNNRVTMVQIAVEKWVKSRADASISGYHADYPLKDLGEPQWPDESFEELFNIGYADRTINSLDHPVVKEFLGA